MSHLLRKSPTILLVEDDPDNLKQMLEWLAPREAILLQARNGEQALRILQMRQVDALISDWQLPGISGLELLKALRSSGFKGPLLICTGFMLDAEHLQQALAAGANDYLRKPLNVVEFNARFDKSWQLYVQQQTLEHFNHSQRDLLSLLQNQLGHDLQRMTQLQELEKFDPAKSLLTQAERIQTLQHLTESFQKLMSWSRYRFSLRELTATRFEVRQLFKSMLLRFGEQAERIQLSGGTGIYIESDIELLQRILLQLLENALTYTQGEVRLKLSQHEQVLRIAIQDQGQTLSEGQLQRFESGEDTGLGLKICQDLLLLLGSRLYCRLRRSSPGSQFYFELPVA